MGGEIVSDESYQAGETDFKAQLTQIKGKKLKLQLIKTMLSFLFLKKF